MGSNYVGYLYYIVVLFLASGLITLGLDVRNYKHKQANREKTAAIWSAWINLSLGVLMFIASWVYKRYYW